jgi:hypothetical protein
MSRNQSTARTQQTRKARLQSLAVRPAMIALAAAGMIAGSTGIAVAATASSAAPVASAAAGGSPPNCQPGYVLKNNICVLRNQ